MRTLEIIPKVLVVCHDAWSYFYVFCNMLPPSVGFIAKYASNTTTGTQYMKFIDVMKFLTVGLFSFPR